MGMKSSSTVLIYCYQSRAIMMIYTFCCQNELKEVGVTKSLYCALVKVERYKIYSVTLKGNNEPLHYKI